MKHHVHHFLIETPDGLVSRGVCRECGEKKDFPNYMPQKGFDYARKIPKIKMNYDPQLPKCLLGS